MGITRNTLTLHAADGVRRTKMKSIDDKYYAQASREIAERRTVAWLVAKALSDANGDEKQAVAIYIKHRVEQLRDKERQARKEKAKRSLKSNSVLIILAGIVFVTIAAWLMIYVLSRIF